MRELGIEYVIFFSNMGGLDHALVMESMRRFVASPLLKKPLNKSWQVPCV